MPESAAEVEARGSDRWPVRFGRAVIAVSEVGCDIAGIRSSNRYEPGRLWVSIALVPGAPCTTGPEPKGG